MERIEIAPRPGWQETVESQGLVFWYAGEENVDGRPPYWHESHHYRMTMAECERIEAATNELIGMCVEAGDWMLERPGFMESIGIPVEAHDAIRETWDSEPPMLYGRFDLAYQPDGSIKLLEFNADTPTSLVEAAVCQWHWMKDAFGADAGPGGSVDQFNRIHEALVERWQELTPRLPGEHVACMFTTDEPSGEDYMTTAYIAETAQQAGLTSSVFPIEHLDFQEGFVDLHGMPIQNAFKLYPWEWMVHEGNFEECLARMGTGLGRTQWIEPIWKMLWSNKGLLIALWERFPGHELLLPAHIMEHEGDYGDDVVIKPFLAREGANTKIVLNGDLAEEGKDQEYGSEGYVVQGFADLGDYDGAHPVLGSWVVDMNAVGVGIRESDNLITNNNSRFVPHIIKG